MAIARKEMNETLYWLVILEKTEYLSREQFESINSDALEIIKLVTSIIKTTKKNNV
jgi:four helix bundle protein